MSRPTIVPNVWSNGVAEDQAAFYADALRDTSHEVTSRYPTEGLLDFQEAFAGQPLTVDVTIGESSDQPARISLINAGDEFRPNPSINFMLNFDPASHDDASEYLDQVYAALTDGGQVLMPLQEYPFSKRYAFVQDRYGVGWQLILTDPAGEPRPFLMPSLLFSGEAQNHCRAAVDSWVSLVPDSRWGLVVEYEEETSSATKGAIMFAEFQLAGQWFTAMDSGTPMQESFTEAVSLELAADGQAELDRYWATLSQVPQSEQCGWCKDAYGVSWQVVPANMAELMEKPDAYAKLMRMGKIEIDQF